MKKLSLITLLLMLIAGAGAGSGYWFLVLEADEDEPEQENRAPQATITTSPANGQVRVDETVSFQGHQSSDPDGDPLTYAWNFGDDNSSSGLTVSHAYGIEGNCADVLFGDERWEVIILFFFFCLEREDHI